MRLRYNVLCIDDQIATLRKQQSDLRRVNLEVGIETSFTEVSVVAGPRETPDELKQRIFQEIETHFQQKSFELILVDLHLGTFEGHEIINLIRDKLTMYRPIVFYSGGNGSGTAKEQLMQAIADNQLGGKSVFLSTRENLGRDLKDLCCEMHTEEQQLNATRGLLMDCTSELDAQILGYLRKSDHWDEVAENVKLWDAIKEQLSSHIVHLQEKVDGLKFQVIDGDLNSFKNWILTADTNVLWKVLDASCRNKIFREILRVHPKKAQHGKTHSQYFNTGKGKVKSISELRNEYAHQTAEELREAHDALRCKTIREELRRHQKNIEEIMPMSRVTKVSS